MSDADAIRNRYRNEGVDGYYQAHGGTYRNPHEPIVRASLHMALDRWPLDTSNVCDLACGSGEVTLALRERGVGQITGIDPYTGAAYRARTGQDVLPLTFEAVGGGALFGQHYSLMVCSFALHLVAVSWLPAVSVQLALVSPQMLVITPHKRPDIKPEWGWKLRDEFIYERVRTRWYTRK